MIFAYAKRVHDYSYATDAHLHLAALTYRASALPGSLWNPGMPSRRRPSYEATRRRLPVVVKKHISRLAQQLSEASAGSLRIDDVIEMPLQETSAPPPSSGSRIQEAPGISPGFSSIWSFLMSLSKLFSLFAVATALVAAPRAQAGSPAHECFSSYKPTRVLPYEVERFSDYATHTVDKVLAGAHVFIPAEPALTAEWLRSRLDRRTPLPTAESECPLDVRGVSLSVQSGGPGFWVTIAANDHESAEEVLRRAQRVVR
jgi:hypothetical protein